MRISLLLIFLITQYFFFCEANKTLFISRQSETHSAIQKFNVDNIIYFSLSVLFYLLTICYIFWIEGTLIKKAKLLDVLMENSAVYDKESNEIDETKLVLYTGKR